jgi:hypothetical protein
MKIKQSLYRKWVAISHNPKALFIYIFAAYGVIWAILDPIMSIIPSFQNYFSGWDRYLIMLSISIVIGLVRIERPDEIVLRVQNSTIVISFGDLFTQKGIRVIPVSQYMYEMDVVPSSLQAIVIRKFIDGGEGVQGAVAYKNALDSGLHDKFAQEIVRFSEIGAEKYYQLGTSAILNHAGEIYLFFAATKTELKGHIPADNCSLVKLLTALECMLDEARVQTRGQDINMPLIGSGMAGINLSPMRILELNLLAVLSSLVDKGNITTGNIRIILHKKYFEQIDLNHFHQSWKIPN